MCVKWRACATARSRRETDKRRKRACREPFEAAARLLLQHIAHYADEDHLEAMPVLILSSGLRNSLLQLLQTQCDQN